MRWAEVVGTWHREHHTWCYVVVRWTPHMRWFHYTFLLALWPLGLIYLNFLYIFFFYFTIHKQHSFYFIPQHKHLNLYILYISNSKCHLHISLHVIRWLCGNRCLSGTLCKWHSLIYKKMKLKVHIKKPEKIIYKEIV